MKNTIKIAGVDYSFNLTIGAVRKLKEHYGIDAFEAMSSSDIGSFGPIVFESIMSVARAEKKEIDLTISDIEDNISIADLSVIVSQFAASIVNPNEANDVEGKRMAPEVN